MTVGGYLVWVRGTNAKVVELFVGRGFRDAFAKAHDMDAARLQQWIDSVRAVRPVPADDSSPADAQLRGTALGADVTMMRRVGGSYSGLRVLVGGEEPIRMAEPTARDFIAMLDSAARVTRELSVPPPTIMASMPIRDAAAPAETPAAVIAPALAPAPAPASAPAPVPASTMGPSTTEAPPELVLQGPNDERGAGGRCSSAVDAADTVDRVAHAQLVAVTAGGGNATSGASRRLRRSSRHHPSSRRQ